jgi:hypothetical protein
MSARAFQRIALAGALLFASQFLAQAQSTGVTQSTLTSGIVGVASGQTVQLNVLNLQETSSSATAAECLVTLEFFNESGTQQGPTLSKSMPPRTAVSQSYTPSATATTRAEIRAVVITQSVSAAAGSTVIPVGAACNIMPSLEIIDGSAGATQIFTTDFRAMTASGVQPLSALSPAAN